MKNNNLTKSSLSKAIFSVLAIYVITAMVACDNNKDNGAPPPVVANPYAGVICPAGSTLNGGNGLCYLPNGQQIGSSNSTTLDFVSDTADNTLTITDHVVYKSFVKNAMGLCETTTWSGGSTSCSRWDNGRLTIVMLGNPSANNSQVYFFPYRENTFSFSDMFSFSGGIQQTATYWPLSLTMATSPYMGSDGFMAQAKGMSFTKAYKAVITVAVKHGKLQDGFFDFMVSYSPDGQPASAAVFATGTFVRCQSAQCVNK